MDRRRLWRLHSTSACEPAYAHMSRKRDKIKGFLRLNSSSSGSTLAPALASVGSSVPMAVLPTGTSHAPCALDPDADSSRQERPQCQ
jgi:hypothetical protein